MIKEVRFREEERDVEQAVVRLQQLKGVLAGSSDYVHGCRKDLCDPRNDRFFPHVYLCNYGTVHVCLPGTCQLGVMTRQGEYVCPVSGLMLGCEESYTMKTEPHWKRVKPEPLQLSTPKVRRYFPTPVQVAEKAARILDSLLFGRERARINDEIHRKRTDQYQRHVDKISKKCQFVCQANLEFIKANVMSAGIPYIILNQQEHLKGIKERIFKVCQVWEKLLGPFYGDDKLYEKISGAPNRPNVECLTIAIIYMMKTGRTDYIPVDAFLQQHLPREKDLPRFNPDGAR